MTGKPPRDPLNPGRRGRPPKQAKRILELVRMFEESAKSQGVEPDQVQLELCKRAAALSFECESIEQRQAKGEVIDAAAYASLCGHLGRIMQRIGVVPKLVAPNPQADEDISAPDRPYHTDWQFDPLWWSDLWALIGNRPRDFYNGNMPTFSEVFPQLRDGVFVDGDDALKRCAENIEDDRETCGLNYVRRDRNASR